MKIRVHGKAWLASFVCHNENYYPYSISDYLEAVPIAVKRFAMQLQNRDLLYNIPYRRRFHPAIDLRCFADGLMPTGKYLCVS